MKSENEKILFLSPLPPPYYGSALSSQMCLDIIKNSNKFEVNNIKLNYSKEIRDIGHINLNKIKGLFYVKKQIRNKIKEFKPNFCYFVPATSGLGFIRDYLFIKKIKREKIPILFHIRSRITKKDWQNPIFRRLYKKTFSNEKAIILGKSLKEDIHRLIEDKNIFILPNATKNEVSDKEFQNIIKKRKEKNSFNIIFLSNMDETKGWLKLLQACSILKKKRKKFNCNFVGAWPSKKEKRKFYNYIRTKELENCVFYLGKKTGKEKNKILENSNVLVFPTEYKLETFGRVIIEGMMFGLPVIANGIASIPSIILNNKTGFILKQNSPEEIAEKIDILLNNKKLRIQMGKLGRSRFLEKFEIENYKSDFLEILNNFFSRIKK